MTSENVAETRVENLRVPLHSRKAAYLPSMIETRFFRLN
jgi:hypothetical protein